MTQGISTTAESRGLIELTGEDSRQFLQGQVSCDINSLGVDQIIHGCHCTPKGRVIFLFSARMQTEQCIVLETHPSIVETAIVSLGKYAVFSKTQIKDISAQGTPVEPAISALQRLRSAVADISVETTELFIPQMLNLDALGYISFKKGCYTGQEVVARAHYLGAVKRRMYHLSLAGLSVPAPGAAILDSQHKPVGNIVNATLSSDTHVEALAVLSSKAVDCNYLCIEGENISVTQLPLPYQLP
ncbi:MAG: hypothetical protein NZ697_04515 [Porticoccaceae bacterium]|nr:hypothetical protein [Porticoccaceae bacterium]